jgi:hypothetical protein
VKHEDSGAKRLADAIAEVAADLQAGRPVGARAESLRRLVADLGREPGGLGVLAFVEALGPALGARGVSMPPLSCFPPSVAAFLEAADEALDGDERNLDDVADRLERAAAPALGVTTREARERALREQIRSEVGASIAASMRAHGLTPSCDLPPDAFDDLDDVDDEPG